MANDLLQEVRSGLAERKGEWRQIADDLDLSYEMISRIGLGTYASSPTYKNLKRIADHLRSKRK